MSTFTGFICKDCCQSIDDCAKNGCNRAFGPPMTAPTTQEKSAPTASEATLCICADPENCREPIPGRICKRTIPPSASSDRNDGVRVSEEALRSARVTACAYRGTGLTYETADIYVTLIDAELQRLRSSRSDVSGDVS